MYLIYRYRYLLGILFSFSFALTSCKVTFVSAYDAVSEQMVTDMQQITTAFFVKVESDPSNKELAYGNSKKMYEELKVKAATLRIRNMAIDKNRFMSDLAVQLESNIKDLEALHKIKQNGLLSADDVSLLKSAFEKQYGAIFKFLMESKARDK